MDLKTRASQRSYKKESHKGIADKSCKRNCKCRLQKGVGKRSWKQRLQKGVAEQSQKDAEEAHDAYEAGNAENNLS